jgi:hypothetical protein
MIGTLTYQLPLTDLEGIRFITPNSDVQTGLVPSNYVLVPPIKGDSTSPGEEERL